MSNNKVKEKSIREQFALRREVEKKFSVKSGIIVGVWITNPETKERQVMPTWFINKPIWLPLVMKNKPTTVGTKEFKVQLTADYRLNFSDLAAVASVTVKLRPSGMYSSHTLNPLVI